MGKKIAARDEIRKQNLLGKQCYLSAMAFLKVKIPAEELELN